MSEATKRTSNSSSSDGKFPDEPSLHILKGLAEQVKHKSVKEVKRRVYDFRMLFWTDGQNYLRIPNLVMLSAFYLEEKAFQEICSAICRTAKPLRILSVSWLVSHICPGCFILRKSKTPKSYPSVPKTRRLQRFCNAYIIRMVGMGCTIQI